MSEVPGILKNMADVYPQLSPSHQQIVDVILRDPETAAFYNVAQLAQAANVSDATVTRFARAVGYGGFPELSRQLQALVRIRLSTKERLERSFVADGDGKSDLLWKSVEEDVQNLHMFLNELDLEGLQDFAQSLIQSETICIVCSRSALSLGLFLQFYLNFLQKNVVLVNGETRTLDLLARLKPTRDIVVGIGFSRYTRLTVNSIKYLSQKGLTAYVITDYPSSPLAQYAAKAFYCPTGIASHLDSFVAPMSLLQALIRKMSSELYSDTMDKLTELEEIWDLFTVYFEEE